MKELENNITNLYGIEGQQWLFNLPSRIKQIARTYELFDLRPVNNLTYHYVLSGFQGSKPIILKLGFDVESLNREAQALKAFSGNGIINILASKDGVLLLERAISGESLRSFFSKKDDEAIAITCKCLNRLHQTKIPQELKFPHIKNWLNILDNSLKIPNHYLQKARKLRDELLRTLSTPVLLHGDLHHDNILQNASDWLAIDPKGVIGEPAYEVAAFIRNPIPDLLAHKELTKIINNRIMQFSNELKISERRIIDWCFVQAVLAWAWTIEDNSEETYFLKLTEIFNTYL